jgi:hypothetical protein
MTKPNRMMAYFFPLLFCAALLLLQSSVSPVSAQETPDPTKVTSTYDQSKNLTEIEFSQLPMKGNNEQSVFLSVTASYKGQKPKPPEEVLFILSVISQQRYRYPDVLSMQVFVEGKKVSDVLMLNLDKRPLEESYLETIGTRMKYKVFQQLIKASSAELQLQNLKLALDASHLDKLRELDARLH